jgi:hypothetical protein
LNQPNSKNVARQDCDARDRSNGGSGLSGIKSNCHAEHRHTQDNICYCESLAIVLSEPIILMTAHGTIDTAVSAIKTGAYDFVQGWGTSKMPMLLTNSSRRLGWANMVSRAWIMGSHILENTTATKS